MTNEEIQQLAKRIVSGKASKEESLQFMKELNSVLEKLKTELKK
jgi:hypothetical protein